MDIVTLGVHDTCKFSDSVASAALHCDYVPVVSTSIILVPPAHVLIPEWDTFDMFFP